MSELLRATLTSDEVIVAPGRPVRVVVEVTNAAEVIDGVMASLTPVEPGLGDLTEPWPGTWEATPDGEPGLTVRSVPALLPLFPDGVGVITLELVASAAYAAGRHDMAVRLASTVRPGDEVVVPLTLMVTPAPAATLTPAPAVRSARHKASYSVICDNLGNTRLELNLGASDPERVAQARFSPAVIVVEPGESAATTLSVKARRHLLGGETSRKLTVVATSPDLEVNTQTTFRQRPLIPRGVRTVIVLATIVALWAAVFVVGLDKALATDPLSKQVPPSFYASVAAKAATASATGPGGRRLNLQAADSAGAAPAGAVPKSGVVVGVGGTITGKVTAASTGTGIGRISVEAVRDTPSGPTLVSSAASGSDGTYSLIGLLPGAYKLLFTAQGYTDLWYPHATSEAAATDVTVNAMAQTPNIDATITGGDATITGTVETGQTPAPPVTVTVQPDQGSTKPIATVTASATGAYTIPDLPAPGTYDLSFSAAGYQVGTDTEVVTGGESHIANTVTLSAGAGSITGTVTDGTNPLGGVTISATANGQTVTSATPTTGAVGQFSIGGLTTPATYLLTFSDTGFGTQTLAEHLGPGQNLAGLAISLAGGAGDVSGLVSSATKAPLGGVTVSVAGGAKPVTTQSLTAGTVGSYELSGLTTPGSYTVTFSLAGYISQTVAVTLTSSGSATNVDATLAVATGTVTGSVTSAAGGPLTGATVSVTNGQSTQSTTSSTSPPGGYSIAGLAAGSYSITYSLTGYISTTALVTVTTGQTATQSVTLTPDPAGTPAAPTTSTSATTSSTAPAGA
jgi:Carboxypeptidase regulatory-like domain